MKSSNILAVLVLASLAAQADAGRLLRGEVTRFRDGDKIVVADQPVRLAALDCPETGKFGGAAATALKKRSRKASR